MFDVHIFKIEISFYVNNFPSVTRNFIIITHINWKVIGKSKKARYKIWNNFPISFYVASRLRDGVE